MLEKKFVTMYSQYFFTAFYKIKLCMLFYYILKLFREAKNCKSPIIGITKKNRKL